MSKASMKRSRRYGEGGGVADNGSGMDNGGGGNAGGIGEGGFGGAADVGAPDAGRPDALSGPDPDALGGAMKGPPDLGGWGFAGTATGTVAPNGPSATGMIGQIGGLPTREADDKAVGALGSYAGAGYAGGTVNQASLAQKEALGYDVDLGDRFGAWARDSLGIGTPTGFFGSPAFGMLATGAASAINPALGAVVAGGLALGPQGHGIGGALGATAGSLVGLSGVGDRIGHSIEQGLSGNGSGFGGNVTSATGEADAQSGGTGPEGSGAGIDGSQTPALPDVTAATAPANSAPTGSLAFYDPYGGDFSRYASPGGVGGHIFFPALARGSRTYIPGVTTLADGGVAGYSYGGLPDGWDGYIEQGAQNAGITPQEFGRLIYRESAGNARAVSPKGAQGPAQFMPGTAQEMGVKNPFDPAEAIPAGGTYLGQQIKRFGDVPTGIAAYNAGPGRVSSLRTSGLPLPDETQAYLKYILGPQQTATPWASAQRQMSPMPPQAAAPQAPQQPTQARPTLAPLTTQQIVDVTTKAMPQQQHGGQGWWNPDRARAMQLAFFLMNGGNFGDWLTKFGKGGAGFAHGGAVRQHAGFGLIMRDSPGRADTEADTVPRGTYILPADYVASRGESNTLAGGRAIDAELSRVTPAHPGDTPPVPVRLSGGEYKVPPHIVAGIGGGSVETGAAILDRAVHAARANSISTLSALPGPKR